MDMLHKVSGTSMKESVEANKQSDYVEEPISPPTVGTEPFNDWGEPERAPPSQ